MGGTASPAGHVRIRTLPSAHGATSFAHDVRTGLGGRPKAIPPKYFYDALGSRLFDAICLLPEYYLTRVEQSLFDEFAAEIAEAIGPIHELVELGSGNSAKTTTLLAELSARAPLTYVPIDISRTALTQAADRLVGSLAGVSVDGLAAEYAAGLARLRADVDPGRRRAAMFISSSLGNLSPDGQVALLGQLREALGESGRLLLGVDLGKSPDLLVPAYDDALGVTAAFNLNLLARVNRELGGRFDLGAFRHRATYEPDPARVEMHLVSRAAQRVRIDGLAMTVSFEEGESIHTENSHKFDVAGVERLAAAVGLSVRRRWTDAGERFCLALLAP